ncbi:MBL fold metallo-hydrolase [Bacteroides helcogenes]|uniref:Metal dependent hydrolase n=1 Tax=Bacteroides helcogenes (strain ATCC 35417 / DSM 20613 / JCM 6297 / CCUG 15421 / P 36-108) TaxID=693979 RepID=E6SP42_BACT6|nr:MBL fold metallo-hydrolase [Bacteroides helcogenes]ADV43812.1 hypothetical protein Bache_1834 [Bacteroides helcogenes P 36-108]MDY5237443.1 MBL fold metallo-hydrolase [Bacteroides helcogenes]
MKLDYIYHSGFAIETDGVTVIIDYYKDSSEESYNKGIVHDRLLERPGVIYVLCSHFHPDHFNREILSWKTARPDLRYVFSKDILKHRRASAEDATYLNKGDIYEDENIRIEAFGSTDVGISFLIDLQGKRFFHAGDLNNWHWSEESTPQEIRKAEGDFLAEINKLQQATSSIDVTMFPVDSRIGKDYMRGAEQFVERIKTTIFAPMHFSEDYQGGNAFRQFAERKGCRFLTITHRGQRFDIEN